MSSATIRKGIKESKSIEAGAVEPLAKARSRRAGGGRKKATDKDPTLLSDLQELVESTTGGIVSVRGKKSGATKDRDGEEILEAIYRRKVRGLIPQTRQILEPENRSHRSAADCNK
jgi:hypothetical protein